MHKRNIIILLFVALLTFGNVIGNGFVGDDEVLFVHNTFYQDWRNIPLLFTHQAIGQSKEYFFSNQYFTTGAVSYRPVALVPYFAEYAVWGDHPMGYHLTSLGVHLLCCLLLYFIFWGMLRSGPAALLGALFFCVHPVQAESVNGISYRHGMISAAFVLGAFLCYMRLNPKQGPRKKYYLFLSVLFFLLALFSKESALCFLPLVVMYDLCFCSAARKSSAGNGKRYAMYAAVLLFYLVIYFCVFPNSALPENRLLADGWLAHGLVICRIFHEYLLMIVAPWSVSLIPPLYRPEVESGQLLAAVGAVAVCVLYVCGIAFAWSRSRRLAFFLFWFALFFLPVSNLIPLANPMAHRFLYLPLVGIAGAAAIGVEKLSRFLGEDKKKKRLVVLGYVFLLCLCVTNTMYINSLWKSNMTFGLALVKERPLNPQGYMIMGINYYQAGRFDEAGKYLKQNVALGGRDPRAYFMLGRCYQQNFDRSAGYYQEALRLRPDYPAPYFGLGKLYFLHGQPEKALPYFQRKMTLQPSYVSGRYLIETLMLLDRPEDAREVLNDFPVSLSSRQKKSLELIVKTE